jgi:hypothetical protein
MSGGRSTEARSPRHRLKDRGLAGVGQTVGCQDAQMNAFSGQAKSVGEALRQVRSSPFNTSLE